MKKKKNIQWLPEEDEDLITNPILKFVITLTILTIWTSTVYGFKWSTLFMLGGLIVLGEILGRILERLIKRIRK